MVARFGREGDSYLYEDIKGAFQKRRAAARTTGERLSVSEENFTQAFARFEEPTTDEVVIIRQPEEGVDVWLEQLQNETNL